jgi:hypothetical protein
LSSSLALNLLSAPDVCKAWVLPSPKIDETLVDSSNSSRAPTIDPQPSPLKGKGSTANKAKNSQGNAAASHTESSNDIETFDLDGVHSDSEDKTKDKTKTETPPTLKKKPDEIIDPHKDWDNGEVLTPKQCKKIMVIGSNYERVKVMNTIRNAQLIGELDIQSKAQKLFEGRRVEQTKALSFTKSTSAKANANR